MPSTVLSTTQMLPISSNMLLLLRDSDSPTKRLLQLSESTANRRQPHLPTHQLAEVRGGGKVPHSVHWELCPVGMEMAFISSAGSQPIRNVSLALIPLQALRATGHPPLPPPTHPTVLPLRRLAWQTQHLTGLSDVDV